jgi:hypothetical protein
VPHAHRDAIIELALNKTELSPRELAITYTDQQHYFVSESTVYRMLKAEDLITSPAYILMQASDQFQHPSTRVNELWQTDFTYFKIIGWGWYYLSTVLDDYSRYVIAWRLRMCRTPWMMPCPLPDSTRSTYSINLGYSVTMDRVIYLENYRRIWSGTK